MQRLSKGVLFLAAVIGFIVILGNGRMKERRIEEGNLDTGHFIITDPTKNYVFTSSHNFNSQGFTIINKMEGNMVYNITLKNTGIAEDVKKWNTVVDIDNQAATGSLVINIYLDGSDYIKGNILDGIKLVNGSAKINIFTKSASAFGHNCSAVRREVMQ